MTDIEKKALALLNEAMADHNLAPHHKLHPATSPFHDALCRAIEQHEAFRQEVSDALSVYQKADGVEERSRIWDALTRFIIPKTDPLVVEAREICARVCEGWTDIPKNRAAAYRDGVHDDEADFAYVLNALRKANERPTHD